MKIQMLYYTLLKNFRIQFNIASQMKKQKNVTHIKEKGSSWRLTLRRYCNCSRA